MNQKFFLFRYRKIIIFQCLCLLRWLVWKPKNKNYIPVQEKQSTIYLFLKMFQLNYIWIWPIFQRFFKSYIFFSLLCTLLLSNCIDFPTQCNQSGKCFIISAHFIFKTTWSFQLMIVKNESKIFAGSAQLCGIESIGKVIR